MLLVERGELFLSEDGMRKSNSFLVGLVAVGVAGAMASVSHAATVVLDDYSTNKSDSYTFARTFPVPLDLPNSFAVTNDGRLTPTTIAGTTDTYIWNGAGLGVGDAVSLDVTFTTYTEDKQAGLRLATGTDRASIQAGREYIVRIDTSGSNGKFYDFRSNGTNTELEGNLAAFGTLFNLTIERLANAGNDAALKITVKGGGFLEQSFNTTFADAAAAPALYFGPDTYAAGGPGGVQFDNLTLTTVPEPASMLLLSTMGALALRRRRQS